MELHTNRFVLVSTFGRLCLAEADTTVLVSAYTVTLIQKTNIVLLNQKSYDRLCNDQSQR